MLLNAAQRPSWPCDVPPLRCGPRMPSKCVHASVNVLLFRRTFFTGLQAASLLLRLLCHLDDFLTQACHHGSLLSFLVCLLAPLDIMLKNSSKLCAFLAVASRNLMFRESASSFVSPVDTTFFDGSPHLFPTRSLLIKSAACVSISFTSMRIGFTPRRLISFECCLIQPCFHCV